MNANCIEYAKLNYKWLGAIAGCELSRYTVEEDKATPSLPAGEYVMVERSLSDFKIVPVPERVNLDYLDVFINTCK